MGETKTWRQLEREAFANIFKELLTKEDITQTYFAELSGISPHQVHSYLHGKYFPTPDNFNKIAEYFGYSFNELYDMMEDEIRRIK